LFIQDGLRHELCVPVGEIGLAITGGRMQYIGALRQPFVVPARSTWLRSGSHQNGLDVAVRVGRAVSAPSCCCWRIAVSQTAPARFPRGAQRSFCSAPGKAPASPSSTSSASSAAAVSSDTAPAKEIDWRWPGLALAAAGGLAAVAYGILVPPSGQRNVDLNPISDDIFDFCDNMFVFFIDRGDDLLNRKDEIQRILRGVAEEESLAHLKFFYNLKEQDGSGGPEAAALAEDAAASEEVPQGPDAASSPPLRVVLYKGQRRSTLSIGSTQELPLQQVRDFFIPVSEEPKDEWRKMRTPRVSGRDFQEHVIAASSPEKVVLLQLYEDTCFLCFLMRPFINTAAKVLEEAGVPVTIKRMNLERNDFPEGCPIARGTPTFVCFRGASVKPAKWEEFKPKDLVDKIGKDFPQSAPVHKTLEELQSLVSQRFQLFTQQVMWQIELNKLSMRLADDPAALTSTGGIDDDTAFNEVVTQMMAKDMKRTDGILDNLKHLQTEVDDVEADAAVMGAMLAEEVIRREREEEAAGKFAAETWAARTRSAASAASAASSPEPAMA